MADIETDQVRPESGTYRLTCGCRIYVHFPTGPHVHQSPRTTQCDELRSLWAEYEKTYRGGHSWTSLNLFLACQRHVGAWQRVIDTVTSLRDQYPRAVDHDNEKEAVHELA
ncbi:hypothetical protein [Streptomyces sp. NPDC093149]|uniref:hypothetical protein n=1 Tax=Streptomyces sp. NPDC093149 TaxID=3366031 RepID=UPI0038253642